MKELVSDIISHFSHLIEPELTQSPQITRIFKAGEDYRFPTDWLIDMSILQKAIKSFNKTTQDYCRLKSSVPSSFNSRTTLNASHTSHWLSIYLFSSSSAALKVTWHSDTDLWDSHRKITEFNKVINLITQDRMKSGNLNKITEAKFAETAIQSKKSTSLIQKSFKTFIKSFSVDLGIICISDMPSSPH